MPAKQGPLTPDRSARHLFGAELRRHREERGMALAALAADLNIGKSSLQRYETAESMIPPELPAPLDRLFSPDGLFTKLYTLACKEIHPDRFRHRMNLEARAVVIKEYSGQIVPGLLQTEEYARAQFIQSNPSAPAEEIEELVTARLTRQALLRAEEPPEHAVLLDEAVLRRPFGSPKVWRDQLVLLCERIVTPTSLVQILPFAHGGHALVGGSLTLLSLDDGTQVAYEESITTGTLLEDISSVHERQRAYDRLSAHALTPQESATFIKTVLEALPT